MQVRCGAPHQGTSCEICLEEDGLTTICAYMLARLPQKSDVQQLACIRVRQMASEGTGEKALSYIYIYFYFYFFSLVSGFNTFKARVVKEETMPC